MRRGAPGSLVPGAVDALHGVGGGQGARPRLVAVASALGPLVGSLMYSSPGTLAGVGPVSGGEMAPTSATLSCIGAHSDRSTCDLDASGNCTLMSSSALNDACVQCLGPIMCSKIASTLADALLPKANLCTVCPIHPSTSNNMLCIDSALKHWTLFTCKATTTTTNRLLAITEIIVQVSIGDAGQLAWLEYLRSLLTSSRPESVAL